MRRVLALVAVMSIALMTATPAGAVPLVAPQSGEMRGDGCVMTYGFDVTRSSTAATHDDVMQITGSIYCAPEGDFFAYAWATSLTLQDATSPTAGEASLSGDADCGRHTISDPFDYDAENVSWSTTLSCTFTGLELNHVYRPTASFYIEGVDLSGPLGVPLVRDAENAGYCKSSWPTSLEVPYSTCTAPFTYLAT